MVEGLLQAVVELGDEGADAVLHDVQDLLLVV